MTTPWQHINKFYCNQDIDRKFQECYAYKVSGTKNRERKRGTLFSLQFLFNRPNPELLQVQLNLVYWIKIAPICIACVIAPNAANGKRIVAVTKVQFCIFLHEDEATLRITVVFAFYSIRFPKCICKMDKEICRVTRLCSCTTELCTVFRRVTVSNYARIFVI